MNTENIPTNEALRERIRAVLDAHPDLTSMGFDARSAGPKPEDTQAFEQARAGMLSDDTVQQVAACLECLQHVRRGRAAKRGSYGLKHLIERWKRQQEEHLYVSNGALIVAVLLGGFRIKRHGGRDPNCSVYINEDDLDRIDAGQFPLKHVKPSPFVKWLFKQAKRDDLVGDLAYDLKRDKTFSPDGDFHAVIFHIERHGDHVITALDVAHKEWQESLVFH